MRNEQRQAAAPEEEAKIGPQPMVQRATKQVDRNKREYAANTPKSR